MLGATGIIGRELVAALARSGRDVVGVSRHPPRSADPRISYLAVDGRDPDALCGRLRGRRFAAVVDLLSFTVDGLEASLRAVGPQCGQYVFISSATVYAGAGPDGRLTEDSPLIDGGWGYPLRKIECERRLVEMCAGSGLPYTIVRPYITYSDQRVPFGPWETDEVLPRLVAGRPVVIGDEIADARTSLTDSRDLAQAIQLLLGNVAALNEAFHIANPETQTWSEVYAVAGQVLGREPWVIPTPTAQILSRFPQLAGKVFDRRLDRAFDDAKLKAACPGFAFEHSLRDGLAEAIAGHQASGARHGAPRNVGKVDRVIAGRVREPSVRRERRRHARALLARAPGDFVRYEVGYRPLLGALFDSVRPIRRGLRSTSVDDYA